MAKGNKQGRMAAQKAAEKRASGLAYELGRWQKKVADQGREIRQLRERLELEELKERSNEAIVALLLARLGADEDHPQVLEHQAVRDALEGYRVLVAPDTDQQSYAMHFVMV